MKTSEVIEIELCVDCLMLAANGDLPDGMDDLLWPGIDDGWIVIPGHLHTVEQCGQEVMDGIEDCPYDEGSFSRWPCDACRRPLDGDRYPASTFRIIE